MYDNPNGEVKVPIERIVSIEVIEDQPRYDFQVEGVENFYFSGVLVHNCRCILDINGMWSREGKPILGAPHIHKRILELYADHFKNNPSLRFDGELYNHSCRDDFNKIVSAVKKQKPTAEDLKVSQELIQYHIYDVPSVAGDFETRNSVLEQNWIEDDLNMIVKVPREKIPVSRVDEVAAEMIADGYEGAMVRTPDGPYENKRSNHLMKWKEFQDDEFVIVDIQEGDGNRAGMAARVVLGLPDGRTFSAGLIGSVDYCRELLNRRLKFIGLMGTVVYQNLTPDGIPRFPKFKAVRPSGL